MATVILYSTTCASTLKMKTDIMHLKHILDTKKIVYEEVGLANITTNNYFSFWERVYQLSQLAFIL